MAGVVEARRSGEAVHALVNNLCVHGVCVHNVLCHAASLGRIKATVPRVQAALRAAFVCTYNAPVPRRLADRGATVFNGEADKPLPTGLASDPLDLKS